MADTSTTGETLGRWSGTLATEGTPTGDRRTINPGALRWDLSAPAGVPLRWVPAATGGHDGARHVGWITNITRVGEHIDGEGTWFDPEFGDYLTRAGKVGLSIDMDDETYDVVIPTGALDTEPVPGEAYPVLFESKVFRDARIRGVTAVDIPAFVTGYIQPAAEAITAAATPVTASVLLAAVDTGRWLMVQHAVTDDDPDSGLWEFPTATVAADETPLDAAGRGFTVTGNPLPDDVTLVGYTDTPTTRIHLYTVPTEAGFAINPDPGTVEAVTWWAPDLVTIGGYHIRPDVQTSPWAHIHNMLEGGPAMAEPSDVPTIEIDVETDETVAEAVEVLDAAIELHRGHMDGTIPTSDESQTELMGMIEHARNLLAPMPMMEPTDDDVMVASAAPVAPPAEWFTPFDLDGPTPLTVTADGRVFGHLATWESCHRSPQYAGTCTPPPRDPNAPLFHLGQVLTADGTFVDVGRLTVGGGHADIRGNVTAALEHYDNAATVVAAVRAHEDSHGIALFGAVVPEATPEQVAALRRSPLSGDWRKEQGQYRLIAAHAVVTPGFPVPRTLVASVSPGAFITSGRVTGCPDDDVETFDATALVAAVAPIFDAAANELRSAIVRDFRQMTDIQE